MILFKVDLGCGNLDAHYIQVYGIQPLFSHRFMKHLIELTEVVFVNARKT